MLKQLLPLIGLFLAALLCASMQAQPEQPPSPVVGQLIGRVMALEAQVKVLDARLAAVETKTGIKKAAK